MSTESSGKRVEVAIAVVFDPTHRQVLICKRRNDTVLAGYWEFPGGKCDPEELPELCAVREVREEVGIVVRSVHRLAVIEHEYPYARVRLHPFVCELVSGAVELLQVAEAKWVMPEEVLAYRFPEANVELVQRVAAGWAELVR